MVQMLGFSIISDITSGLLTEKFILQSSWMYSLRVRQQRPRGRHCLSLSLSPSLIPTVKVRSSRPSLRVYDSTDYTASQTTISQSELSLLRNTTLLLQQLTKTDTFCQSDFIIPLVRWLTTSLRGQVTGRAVCC